MAYNRLAQDEYVPFAPAHVGTINKHHCKSGRDNDKLFITRCEDGYTILAYCHHCGYAGKHDQKETLTVDQMKSFKPLTSGTGDLYTMPSSIRRIQDCDSAEAKLWINKAGLTSAEAHDHGIVWAAYYNRVVIPVYTFGQLSMMQTRKIMRDDTGPKYCNYKNFEGLPFRSYNRSSSMVPLRNRVVLVEDALSCIKVGKHLPCIALMGTHLSDVVLAYLIKRGFDEFNVFLDDDNTEVRIRQQDLYRRLRVFGKVKVLHTQGIDPKEMPHYDLQTMLDFTL